MARAAMAWAVWFLADLYLGEASRHAEAADELVERRRPAFLAGLTHGIGDQRLAGQRWPTCSGASPTAS